MEYPLAVKLGILPFLGVLLVLRQRQLHRFWDGWDQRFRDECIKSAQSTAVSIPALVRSWEQERKQPPNPLTGTYQGIFRLLDERRDVKHRDIFSALLLLVAFCLNIYGVFVR